MKIESSQEKKRINELAKRESKKIINGNETSFFKTLSETSQKLKRQKLNSLLEKIDSQASELMNSFTLSSLKEYKNLVRQFIQIAISEIFEVNEKISTSSKGKSKILITVKNINSKIEELTKEFFNKNKNIIEFMSKLDQIRGLLVNLYT